MENVLRAGLTFSVAPICVTKASSVPAKMPHTDQQMTKKAVQACGHLFSCNMCLPTTTADLLGFACSKVDAMSGCAAAPSACHHSSTHRHACPNIQDYKGGRASATFAGACFALPATSRFSCVLQLSGPYIMARFASSGLPCTHHLQALSLIDLSLNYFLLLLLPGCQQAIANGEKPAHADSANI